MSRSLIRKNQLHPDIADLVSGYGTDFFITPTQLATTGTLLSTNIATTGALLSTNIATTGTLLSTNIATTGSILQNQINNLSGSVANVNLSSVVRLTGNQTISGIKNFASRPTVDGTGVLTFADTGNFNITVTALLTGENIVYTTGDQTIEGNKDFTSIPTVNGIPLSTGISQGGSEYVFPSDLQVVLSSSKTFGKYQNGQTIPASGKTTSEVIRLAIVENINPTIVSSSYNVTPTAILIGQTGISNKITFSGQILNPGATLSISRLEWRRGTAPFQTLIENTTSPYTHIDTNMGSNSNSYSYRYIIGDNMGGLTTGNTLNIPFLYGNYFGYSSATSLTTVTEIEALGNELLSNGKSRTIVATTPNNQSFTYYAYNSTAGNLNSIIQNSAAPVLGAFQNQGIISGPNKNGVNVSYIVYKSLDPGAFSSDTLAFS